MCLLDNNINSSLNLRVLFVNGTELTLVSSHLAKKNKSTFEKATYTLEGLGGQVTTYKPSEDSMIYTIPLLDSSGKAVYVKDFQ